MTTNQGHVNLPPESPFPALAQFLKYIYLPECAVYFEILMSANYIFIYTILLLDIICIVAVIFFERKNPASTIAWMLVLIFAPIVGIIAYMVFGNGFPARKKKKKYSLKAARDSIYDDELTQSLNISNDDPPYNSSIDTRMIDYLKVDGDGIYTDKNQIRLFLNGKNKFESLLEDIRSAKDHIHFFYYILYK